MSELATKIANLLSIWRNPVFLRFFRSRLRLRKSIFWYLLTLIIATFVVTLVFVLRTNSGVSPRDSCSQLVVAAPDHPGSHFDGEGHG